MSNFREVFCEAHKTLAPSEGQIQRFALDTACATTAVDHPRLWAALENHVAHCYERMNQLPPSTITADFDWQSIKQWIIDHWPQIVSLIISIIMLFLAL